MIMTTCSRHAKSQQFSKNFGKFRVSYYCGHWYIDNINIFGWSDKKIKNLWDNHFPKKAIRKYLMSSVAGQEALQGFGF